MRLECQSCWWGPSCVSGAVNDLVCIQDNCAKLGLQPLEAFVGKIIQLYEMIVVRHGLMLVGQSFGMKTAAHRVLAAALSDLNEKVTH